MPSDSSFKPRETHCGVVRRLVTALLFDKAKGLDGISARLLKEVQFALKLCLLSPL